MNAVRGWASRAELESDDCLSVAHDKNFFIAGQAVPVLVIPLDSETVADVVNQGR